MVFGNRRAGARLPDGPLTGFHSRRAPHGRSARYTDCCRRGFRPSERWCPRARFGNMVAGGCDLVIGDRFTGSRWGICFLARSPPAPRRHVLSFNLSSHQGRSVMARRNAKRRAPSARKAAGSLPITNPNAAAIDVHSDNHVVCVPADRATPNVRTFGANSSDLLQIAAWLKQCGIESNGKRKSRRVRKGKNQVAIALRLAARSLQRSHSALGAYFRRMNSRLGLKGAVTATAHKLARYVYAMLKHGEAYVSQSLEEYEAATQERIERTLRKKARALGYDLVP